ncbi:TPA: ABC transporter ATP-binding protein [Klebsiella quasipneumoniae subsp. similipneumoniae]|uniref:ABC transporter ATP-binding protein n=1 Tax=Klebsiella pneumoniae complex TaxID=3390273 RepID=UPI001B97AAB4|nr:MULTISPECIES: ABC transporter ATP-binding protein [Klebsiella]HDT1828130.1 ABC transporter ATP-binding protein [Klebsiella quasipneumoniae subsp. similipneumoniae]MBR8602671.1 ABC transporter ATP-binding protein [Klebsiella pneumoniae subsp. pneumoniae]MCI8181380.1 ABC transporter ATP-binding protein [Klebsiella pneumoniae]MCP5702280.1 ABC transporter ATP-binding protein [Klebsiella pneumoniae]MCP6062325.1 ABC transporter ATP-binding protein [Klebsiella pneumoniae]
MALIKFENAGLDFPIFDAASRSIKKNFIGLATGGTVGEQNGRVVVSALSNLNFEINDGERVGLIGHNGAGKTTLLRMFSKVYYPTAGKVTIEGDIGSLISISLGINPEFTGRENIYIRGALLGLRKKDINSKIDEIINFTDLGDFIDMPVRTYSSGMQMRLGFSVSTIFTPEILLMDEWLSVGDEGFKDKAERRLSDIISSTKILILASHSYELLKTNCTRILWLEHGSIKMDGKPEDVLHHYFKVDNAHC